MPESRLDRTRRAYREERYQRDPVLQAVLDAIAGTLDTSLNIADHPNVKFAQMKRLELMNGDWLKTKQ